MPLGPSVVLTRSAMAMAPTKLLMRAPSPLSTWEPALITADSMAKKEARRQAEEQ